MANYETLKSAIQQVVKTNGNNEITGNLLQQQLLAIVNSLGVGYQYAGIATPATNPGTPDQNVFYLASTAGTYANFDGLVLNDGEIAILKYNGAWFKDSTGVASLESVNQLGEIFLRKRVISFDDDILLFNTKNGTRFVTPTIKTDNRPIRIKFGDSYSCLVMGSTDGDTFVTMGSVTNGKIFSISSPYIYLNFYKKADSTQPVSLTDINFSFDVFNNPQTIKKISSFKIDNTILSINGKFVNKQGALQSAPSRCCSELISVDVLPIIVKGQPISSTTSMIPCYDENGDYIGDYSFNPKSCVVVIDDNFSAIVNLGDLPSGAKYFRLNGYVDAIGDSGFYKLNNRDNFLTPTFNTFENKGGFINKSGGVTTHSSYYNTNFIELVNSDLFVKNIRYNEPYVVGIAFYSSPSVDSFIGEYVLKNIMGGSDYYSGKISKESFPVGAKYVRCSTNTTDAYVIQINDFDILNRLVNVENKIIGEADFIALPKTPVPLIKDESYYLYLDNIINKPIQKFAYSYVYNSGVPVIAYKRLSKLTPNAAGIKTIEIAINDGMGLTYGNKAAFDVEVLDGALIDGLAAKVLSIGDSFTYIGGWLLYEKNKLQSFGASLEFIGNVHGNNANRKCEAWGGAKAEFYAQKFGAAYEIEVGLSVNVSTGTKYSVLVDGSSTYRTMTVIGINVKSDKQILRISQDIKGAEPWQNIPLSGIITKVGSGYGDDTIAYSNLSVCDWNPFWDVQNNKLSFSWYCNKWNVAPDILFIQFMHNDVKLTYAPSGDDVMETGLYTDDQFNAAIDNIETLISTWNTEMGATKKIIVSLQSLTTLNGGPTLIPQYWKYISMFYERYKNDNRIIIMPVYPFVDNVNAYPTQEVTPCEYYTNDKELMATDGHPNLAWEQYGHCTAASIAKAIIEMN